MRRVLKWLAKLVLGLVVVGIAAAAVGLGYRAWRQQAAAPLYDIETANGIDEAQFVDIDGVDQWVTIRGQDQSNPVVLVLHGGPGSSMTAMSQSFLAWEREFVVVQWDQPGAGRTFRAAGRQIDSDLTIEQMADDGNRIAEWLINRLNADKVILFGWSWGSALGVYMVKAQPALYSAFIGTGQLANPLAGEAVAYENVLAKAEQRGDSEAIEALTAIGPPPYDSPQELTTHRGYAAEYELGQSLIAAYLIPALLDPRTTFSDIYDFAAGSAASATHFFGNAFDGPIADMDLKTLGPRFDVPVYVIHGAEDDFTPAALARDYFDFIAAPDKAYFPIEGAGHMALITESEQFLGIVRDLPIP